MKRFHATLENVNQVRAFVQAMKDQGFQVKGTYEPRESEARAATGSLNGYTVMCIARDGTVCADSNDAEVTAWGCDGLQVKIDYRDTANILERLHDAMFVCGYCDKRTEKTFRHDFAGRICRECKIDPKNKLPEGWDK